MKSTRRQFLRGLGQTGLAAWLGTELTLDAMAQTRNEPATGTGTERGILRIRLMATQLDAMESFYAETMGWPVERDGESLEIKAGGTELRFDPSPRGAPPYYHLAWAIPSNKFEAGKAWLAERTTLLAHPDGRDEFHFTNAGRRGVYFADPAGNILELIARDDLGDSTAGPFTLGDVLYVNHFGLVVPDMAATIAKLRHELGLSLTAPPTAEFATMGDAHRHLVLVPRQRLWLPEMNRGAEIFASHVVLHGPETASVAFRRIPYWITVQP